MHTHICIHYMYVFRSFTKDDLKVSVGGHNSCKWDAKTTIFSVDSIFPHPSYDNQTNFADIMLVKLIMSITFNQFVRPICLPKLGIIYNFEVFVYTIYIFVTDLILIKLIVYNILCRIGCSLSIRGTNSFCTWLGIFGE